jgi:hypothetical protein
MMRPRIWLRTGAALSLIAAAAAATPSLPDSSAGSSCRLFADDPVWDGGYLVGVGGRIGCTSIRTVTVRLRQDRPWRPDRTLAESSPKTGSTVILEARRYCTGNTDMKVFTETLTNTGGKTQSGRLLTSC